MTMGKHTTMGAPNPRVVCPESCHLLAGESPVAVMVRQPRSRQPVLSGDRWC
jgi:hypothetical protein